jgi:hypothetical protein
VRDGLLVHGAVEQWPYLVKYWVIRC